MLEKGDRELEEILAGGDDGVELVEQRVGVAAENGIGERGDGEVARHPEHDPDLFGGDRR